MTYRCFLKNDLGDIAKTIKVGSTRFSILFDIAKFLDIDIRNLLMFDDNTYEFENSFEMFEEFFVFIGQRFKKFRIQNGLRAIDVDRPNNIYAFENNKEGLSLTKFYSYLDKLGMSSDEFFWMVKIINYQVNIMRNIKF